VLALSVISEHAGEASFLWLQRCHAVSAPNYSFQQLADLDERLDAHIDGLRVAGEAGWGLALAGVDLGGPDDFFPASVLALEVPDDRLELLLERLRANPEAIPGVISALGWVSARYLSGRVKAWLESPDPLRQKLAVAACALHRKDPGAALERLIASPVDSVRIRALRAAGELGRRDLLPRLMGTLAEPKPEARFWAAWSAVLLGDRGGALELLATMAMETGRRQSAALQLALMAMPVAAGHELLMRLDSLPGARRLRIIGSGHVGDPRYAPWLIDQMTDAALARVAAEAFVNMTGADFNLDQLESLPPEGFEDGPTEDPDDENVDLPEDIALPWPDVSRLRRWWDRHAERFPAGRRLFLGQPPEVSHCHRVLRDGFQRQRHAAAIHLALLSPGVPLFPVTEPAWRQSRRLETL
jgi:uncharacterized protein (TIGR02270 family)